MSKFEILTEVSCKVVNGQYFCLAECQHCKEKTDVTGYETNTKYHCNIDGEREVIPNRDVCTKCAEFMAGEKVEHSFDFLQFHKRMKERSELKHLKSEKVIMDQSVRRLEMENDKLKKHILKMQGQQVSFPVNKEE